MEWWKKTIVYECYPKSFRDTKDQGSGTIKGITSKLDYLKSLGVGAIWITPVYSSPMVDNGYDVADYYAIDPQYGDMADMDELIGEAKKRDIRIVMDLVFNHSSDKCAWFIESASSRDNPKADWYVWRDPKEDGSAPSNWRALFGGSAWKWCEARKQYYLHSFAAEQPDLNWENKEVRKALYDVANFWVDKGIGGFRVDAISYIKKPEVFLDGEVDGADGLADLNKIGRNKEGILDFLKEFRKEVREGKDIFLVGETNSVDVKQLKKWVGEDGVFDMVIEFTHISPEFRNNEKWCEPEEWTLKDLKQNIISFQYAINDEGWLPIYFENHDKPRLVSHYFRDDIDKKKAAKLMAVLQMCLRGTPFIYQGQEIGMSNVAYADINDYDDISSYTQYELALAEGYSKQEALAGVHNFSRDNCRTPMQWNDGEFAGFSKAKPWLAVNDNYKEVNVKRQEEDPSSVLNFYRELSKFRQKHKALIEGRFRSYEDESDEVFIFDRTDEEETIRILLNFMDYEVKIDPKYEEDMDPLLCSEEDHEKGRLKPLEALLIVKYR
ncbi:MAG: alpha-glucosidase [Erysipelotrichaceae bacterium]|nr:alpha-glucosidase [Erysipelotrichaceae bacterium]